MPALRNLLPDLGRRTLVMGILNITPDSFSDGGRFLDPAAALAQARELIAGGADLLDIGGESTRPGAQPVFADEEMRRVLPVLEAIHSELPTVPLSLDTTKSAVARAGIAAGATLLNDISGGTFDPALLTIAAAHNIPVCLMHLPLSPQEMGWSRAGGTLSSGADVVGQAIEFLRRQVAAAKAAGIGHDQIVIDPGFGFGKTPEQNLQILRRIRDLKAALFDLPLLLGPSRKSTIARILGGDSEQMDPDRTAGTAALVGLATVYGADMVRVHDAAFMARVVRLTDAVVRG